MGEGADPAIDSLRAALAISPDDATLRRLLAERLAERGRVEEAIEEYRHAIRTSPDTGLRLALAQLYLRTGRAGPAEMVLEDLLRDSPTCGPAFVLRARILLETDRPADAIESYGHAIAIDPSLADERLAIALGFSAGSQVASSTETRETRPRAAKGPAENPESQDRTGVSGGTAPTVDPRGPSHGRDPAPMPDEVDSAGFARARGEAAPESGHELSRYGAEGRLADDPTGLLERPRIAFADVGGMEGIKEEIRLKIIYPRQHPELYEAYGQHAGGGILLYGPPGCGKTHLARATAGELGASFISVGIADVLDMWIGSSERNLRAIFNVARGHAPSVLFFDEVDALAASRTDFRNSAARHVINQFLAELDGADASNEGVLVIGATNAPWHMDSAFRRPGRFDQVVFVPPPDQPAREEILRVLLRDRPADGIQVERVAATTDGYSGADLMGIVNRAIQTKLAAAMKDGIPRPISTDDLMRAARAASPTTREWFATVRNYVLYANEGGIYDPVRPYLKGR